MNAPIVNKAPSTIKEFEEALSEAKEIINTQAEHISFLYDQIGDRSRIVVSRKWDSPEIKVEYNHVGIRIHMCAEDYIKSVISQVLIDNAPKGWRKIVNWNFPTKEKLQSWMLGVVKNIEDEIKEASSQFPPPVVK